METMTFGRDQTDWDLLAEAGEEFLIERARLGRLTSYTEMKALQAHYGKQDAR